jgi:hypothetical protein
MGGNPGHQKQEDEPERKIAEAEERNAKYSQLIYNFWFWLW